MPTRLSPSLVATITSCDEVSRKSFRLPRNAKWLLENVAYSKTDTEANNDSDRDVTPDVDLRPVTLMLALESLLQPRNPAAGYVFSRGDFADIAIAPDSANGVSREHFTIQICAQTSSESTEFRISFLHSLVLTNKSKSGTQLVKAGCKVPLELSENEESELASGDRIQAGSTQVEVWVSPEPLELFDRLSFQEALEDYISETRRLGVVMPDFLRAETREPNDTNTVSLNIEEDELIGSGSYGYVYKVMGPDMKMYAVKILKRETDVRSVREQLQMARMLPHIIRIYWDLNLAPNSYYAGRPYIIMDLAIGSLENMADLEVWHVEEIFGQLLQAVGFMHRQHLTHRDLKPANILLKSTNPMHILVSDFDFTKWEAPLKRACGSIRYAAPEIWAASFDQDPEGGFYNHKVDVWSLGMMLLNFCIEGGLPTLDTPGQELAANEPWTDTVKRFLNEPSGVREDFEYLTKLSMRILDENPQTRPDIQIVNDWLQCAIEQRLTSFLQ